MTAADPAAYTPVVEATRWVVRGLPEGHSGRRLADVPVVRSPHGWRVGDTCEWVGPGGTPVDDPVDMDLDTALEAARIEAARVAAAVLAVHPR
ncbi:hypothetical protein [Nocardia thailandica]